MEHLLQLLAMLNDAIKAGRSVTITADDITITASELTTNGLNITIGD